jgi:hypothetical protein
MFRVNEKPMTPRPSNPPAGQGGSGPGTQLFVVGKYLGEGPAGRAWELQGVFSSEDLAADAITHYAAPELYFIGPILLDKSFPEETIDWPGAYYPFEGYGDV